MTLETAQPWDGTETAAGSSSTAAHLRAVWRFEVETDPEAALSRWGGFLDQFASHSFQSEQWISNWYNFAAERGLAEPIFVVAEQKVHSNQTQVRVALPLCRYRRLGAWVIAAPDLGVSDVFAPVTNQPGVLEQTDFIELIKAVRIALPPHDLILLQRLDLNQLAEGPAPVGSRHLLELNVAAWRKPIDEQVRTALFSTFSKKLRSTAKKKIRAMSSDVQRELVHQWPVREPQVLKQIWEMRDRRRDALAPGEHGSNVDWSAFYQRMHETGADSSPFCATVLYANGRTVSAALGIRHHHQVTGIVLTMEPGEHEKYSPGLQAAIGFIERAAEQGLDAVDFSIGNQPYKKSLGAIPRPLHTLLVPNSWLGNALWLGWKLRHAIRRRLEKR
ncbi:MAG: GNAT family N-acetyltransferase [Pseudomonadota bacterium]